MLRATIAIMAMLFSWSAQAAVYNIALDEFGGPSVWFGTFETDTSDVVTSASILVDGVTFGNAATPGLTALRLAEYEGQLDLVGYIASGPLAPGVPALALGALRWSMAACTDSSCRSGGPLIGEMYITPVPVPPPAAGLLLLAGLGCVAALRRRRISLR